MKELKNCPFCGNKPNTGLLLQDGEQKYLIECTNCNIQFADTIEEHVREKWNKRLYKVRLHKEVDVDKIEEIYCLKKDKIELETKLSKCEFAVAKLQEENYALEEAIKSEDAYFELDCLVKELEKRHKDKVKENYEQYQVNLALKKMVEEQSAQICELKRKINETEE